MHLNKVALLVALSALLFRVSGNAGPVADRARKELDSATCAFFGKEIKDHYPKHVAAFAIVEVRVTRVAVEAYCPKSGAACGPSPSCRHEKVSVPALDLKLERVLFSTGPFKWPGEFLRYPVYRRGTFQTDDRLQLSLYGYRTESVGISRIRNLRTEASPKKKHHD